MPRLSADEFTVLNSFSFLEGGGLQGETKGKTKTNKTDGDAAKKFEEEPEEKSTDFFFLALEEAEKRGGGCCFTRELAHPQLLEFARCVCIVL